MAAVRCAARSFGGSLLQRTQAAVAEEGRPLVPSRFMRSRQLSTKVSEPKFAYFPHDLSHVIDDVASHNRILCNRNSSMRVSLVLATTRNKSKVTYLASSCIPVLVLT
uniref:Uncharacterized protein n=1 Tax=Aegilops tauschii subsp. strangulata TaxID=200361 RepID=A0A452Z7F4_AEGTS